ncbi:hypothetical protein GJU39_00095 [Pedobacter petrophilus]|uniref:SPOR domain-containing protein n=1 Tax=Pedobacter petrophilus TaxID=1908241 RepID=A0A7K0FSX8_9SPHI|nr:SPOR domain-containing protein [Pedobacter petrophilus]MRX74471.1 hypothetical protein [Pedobacter petrophilus]
MPENKGTFYKLLAISIKLSVLLLFLFWHLPLHAQEKTEAEEVSVYLNVQRVGNTEISSLIRNDTAYLPISEIFDFLKITNRASADRDSLKGYFINSSAPFLINRKGNQIIYKEKTYLLRPGDLIKTPATLYLRSQYFGSIFGLEATFSFRNLSVTISTDIELPALREMRLSEMRNNINQLKGEAKADTTISRTYPAFHFGTADWSVISAQDSRLGSDTRASLRLGGLIAGGETDVAINYHSTEPLIERNQYYQWRLANNDNTIVRQITAGKIAKQSISSIFAPVVGVQVTNAPTTLRRSFGTYTISNTTQPNWVVELYINNVLVNYVRADASGFYSFEVPLIYGSSLVKLRFYGPAGEERTVEQSMNVPFNFLPKNEFEYTATAGFVEDGAGSRFSRLSANYGVTSFLTAGAGTEYLSSVSSGSVIPFINTSARLLPNLLISAEYAYDVRTRALLTYRLASGLQIELYDTWYKRGQTAVNNTFTEERKAIVSIPFRGKSFSAFSRLTVSQMMLPGLKYATAEWLVSGNVWNLNGNVNTFGLFSEGNAPYIYSNGSLSARLFKSYLFTQHVLYEYRARKIIGFKEELERRVFNNGYLKLSYESNLQSNIRNFEIGLRYDFQIAQTGASIRTGNTGSNFLQFASGSLFTDAAANYRKFDNRTNVGKGGISVVPFLDLNFNGRKDNNEPRAIGLKVLNNRGGNIVQSVKDTAMQITQLEPYVNYLLELDPSGFENVAWQLKKKVYSIAVDPNIMKIVEVPVSVMGEAGGNVNIKDGTGEKGIGRIILQIYQKGKKMASTITESDGYFSYLGLPPGDYRAVIDSAQLEKLNLKAEPGYVDFKIKMSLDGSVTDGLAFTLINRQPKKADTSAAESPAHQRYLHENAGAKNLESREIVVKNKSDIQHSAEKNSKKYAKVPDIFVPQNESTRNSDAVTGVPLHLRYGFTVQIAHFKIVNASASRDFLLSRFGYDAFIEKTGKRYYYNVYVTGLNDAAAARRVIKSVKYRGFPDAFLLPGRTPNKP